MGSRGEWRSDGQGLASERESSERGNILGTFEFHSSQPNVIRLRNLMGNFKHKTLGEFKHRDYFGEMRWEGTVDLPAFAPFKYLANGRQRRSSKVPVAIYCDDQPPKNALKVLSTIKRSQKKLVSNICNAFFKDLRQQGYDDLSNEPADFGMWWSRDPVAVALSCREALMKRRQRERMWEPEDLFAVLYEPSIEIHPDMIMRDGQPRTLIDMGAEFEEEHGVSILTDGKNVLGLGYSGEA